MDEASLFAVPELVSAGPTGARQLAQRLVQAVKDHQGPCQIQPYLIVDKLGARDRWEKLPQDRDADAEQARGRLLSKFIKTLQLDADALVIDSHGSPESATEDLWQRVSQLDKEATVFLASVVESQTTAPELSKRPVFWLDVRDGSVQQWPVKAVEKPAQQSLLSRLVEGVQTMETRSRRKRTTASIPAPEAAPQQTKRSRRISPRDEPSPAPNQQPPSPHRESATEQPSDRQPVVRQTHGRGEFRPVHEPPPDRKAIQRRRALEDKVFEFLISLPSPSNWDSTIHQYVRKQTENPYWSLEYRELRTILRDLAEDKFLYISRKRIPPASLPKEAELFGLTEMGLEACRELLASNKGFNPPWTNPQVARKYNVPQEPMPESRLIKSRVPWASRPPPKHASHQHSTSDSFPADSNSHSLSARIQGVESAPTTGNSRSLSSRIESPSPSRPPHDIRPPFDTRTSRGRSSHERPSSGTRSHDTRPPHGTGPSHDFRASRETSPNEARSHDTRSRYDGPPPAGPSHGHRIEEQIDAILLLFAEYYSGQWDHRVYTDLLRHYPGIPRPEFDSLIEKCKDKYLLKDETFEERRKPMIPRDARFLKLRRSGIYRMDDVKRRQAERKEY